MKKANAKRLSQVGPKDPDHGFPLWYEDARGVRLQLGLGLTGSADPKLPAVGERLHPTAPINFPSNYPEEAFYFLAESIMVIGGAGTVGRAKLVLALEAAFGGDGKPDPHTRVVFARIRVRLDDVVPFGKYVVTHPYGVTDELEADDRGRVFDTLDLGIAEEDFGAVVHSGQVAPFLRWATSPPTGYVGDGVQNRPVTGSPFSTNFFRVDGPRVAEAGGPVDPQDPGNKDRIQTNLFTVQGKKATRQGAEVTSATYRRDPAGQILLKVHARSAPGQNLELAAPRVAFTRRESDYLAYADAASVPKEVWAVNTSDKPATRSSAPVTDEVEVTRAEWSSATKTLTVEAHSSDPAVTTLTVTAFGPLSSNPTVFPSVDAVPATIEVTSTKGGRSVRWVDVTGNAYGQLPLLADAGDDQTVITGRSVTLDGRASRGTISGYTWKHTLGPIVTLKNAATPQASFTAPAPGSLTFELEVQGPGGPVRDTVTIVVQEKPEPPTVQITQAEFRTSRQQYRVAGTTTDAGPFEVIAKVNGHEVGRSAVDETGAWEVRPTLTTSQGHLRPSTSTQVEVTTTQGGRTTAPVNIRN